MLVRPVSDCCHVERLCTDAGSWTCVPLGPCRGGRNLQVPATPQPRQCQGPEGAPEGHHRAEAGEGLSRGCISGHALVLCATARMITPCPQRRDAATNRASDRPQVSDYCEAPGGSQPNALETVHVAAGVTLRGGSQSRSGPPRPRATAGTVGQGTGATMSREEFSRYLAQQEIKAARAKRVSSDTASRPSLRAVLPAAAGGTAKAEPGAAANGHAMPALFADLPDSEPATLGGTLRTAESKAEAGRLTSKVDVNPMLFGAADWGAPGTVASSSNGSSLTFAKPSDKQRALEVAQVGRMPRNRLTQPQLLGGTAR
eukprot:56357-Chlamydomonas_euryale.AAC.3